MSLINEALKRTRDAVYQSSADGPASVDHYRIANNSKTASLGSGLGIVLAAAIALAACVGGIVFFASHSLSPKQKDRGQASPGATVNRAPVPAPAAPASTSPTAQDSQPNNSEVQVNADNPPVAPVAMPDQAAEDALVAKLLQRMKTEQAAAAKPPDASRPAPPLPKLVLQGIMSQGNSREAMINGCTVREGDQIEGAQVVAIDARSAKLRFADQEFTLRMP